MSPNFGTEKLEQELQLLTEYLSAVKVPDPAFLRTRSATLAACIEELAQGRSMDQAAA